MLEYLILNGKFQAAKHLNATTSTSLREQLLSHFGKGNREEFMDIYNMLHKQSKLEFYLRVYFLIYSIHPSLRGKSAIPQPQKIAFKDYLDNRGSQLAKTNQFLEFYALPFIKKPLQHINFKNLFKKEWVVNLKQKLQIFITEEQRILKSEIAKVFQTNNYLSSPQGSVVIDSKNMQDKVKQMQKINKKLFQEVKQFADKYHVLQDNHKLMMEGYNSQMMQSQSKWFQITKQLVQCSKTFIQMLISTDSDVVADRRFIKLKKRTEKYERFVNKRFDDLVSHSQDISIFDKPSISDMSYSVTPHTQKNFHSNAQLPSNNIEAYLPTDYHALKIAFKKSSPQQKISILGGFFWRVLKSKSKQVRRLNILGMLHYDVLGIKTGEIQPMLASRQLMKPVIRLIQLISFDNFGKCLAFNSTLLKDMVGLVTQCQDETCFENIICIIAQISSQRPFKIRLINEDVIQVCMAVLRNKKYHNNQIVLQNATAIMLNMLEKPEGSKKFERQRDLFEVLKTCLTLNYKIPRSLIYGIIFSLLQNQQLFKLAHIQHLPQFFSQILKIDPHISKVQLRYLKNKLAKFQPKPKQQQVQDWDNQEFDYNQQEDDQEIQVQDQYISQIDDLMRAHQELVRKYGLKGKDGERQTQEIKQIYQQYIQNRLPRFNTVQQTKVSKVSSPATKLKSSQLPKIQQYQSPSLKPLPTQQPQKSTQKPSLKKNNFVEPVENISSNNSNVNNLYSLINPNTNQNIKSNPNVHKRASKLIDDKQKQLRQRQRQRQRKQEQFQILSDQRKMKKSVSADRGIGRNIENSNKIYQSNKFSNNQKVSQFKPAEDRSYRSPQQQKRPRQEVLKQLNEQIKAEQRRKQQTENRRQNVNNSLYASQRQPRKGDEGQVFQSRPKLRRTPPRE